MLTDMAVRKAIGKPKSYKMADGGGLYLFVTPAGQRYWRMDYAPQGRCSDATCPLRARLSPPPKPKGSNERI